MTQLQIALNCYTSAARDWSRSQLRFQLEDAQVWASKVLRAGGTEEQLDEIWYRYN